MIGMMSCYDCYNSNFDHVIHYGIMVLYVFDAVSQSTLNEMFECLHVHIH